MTNPNGRFGIHGGQYIPETLMNAVIELEQAYNHYKDDPEFNAELTRLFNDYANRPSRLYYAEKMTRDLGGAKIYLKREDLNHTRAHKINNVLGQALLAKKMGKTRLIAETGAGQHGVAIATAAEVGMDGLILPDIPFEEKEEFDGLCKLYGLDLISLIAPPPSAHRPRPPKKGAALPPYSKKRGTRLPIFFWKNALSYFCFFSSSSLSSRSQTPSIY